MDEVNPFKARLIGHGRMMDNLCQLVRNQRTPHALLFAGPEGVGKRLAAYVVAAELLAAASAAPANCFRLLAAGNHPDLHPVVREEEKKDLSIESIRQVRASLQLAPFSGSASVAIIDNAHQMSIAASNALLLTLEEPTAGRYLFLITHAPQKLPETIVSRCQTVHFGELAPTDTQKILASLFPKNASANNLALLRSLCESSLAALGLNDFVEPRTLLLHSEAEAWKHIASLLERTKSLEQSLSRIFSNEGAAPGDCLSLASLLSEEKGDDLTWLLLRSVARRCLRNAPSGESARYADLLLQALEAERLVRERNASPQLQLSSLFLRAGNDEGF